MIRHRTATAVATTFDLIRVGDGTGTPVQPDLPARRKASVW